MLYGLITESRKNEIKRQIGQAFLNILKFYTFKQILLKPSTDRSDWEISKLVNLLKS